MYDEVIEIFEYLPINRTTVIEEEYITHLWDALTSLNNSNNSGTSFAIMPFHLLFMMVIQYKILRISKERNRDYLLVCTFPPGREHEKIRKPESVFSIASMNESSMADIFTIIDVPCQIIGKIKNIIKDRNDKLAHAKGSVDPDPEKRIEEYLGILRQVQPFMEKINNDVADRWLAEMGTGQDGVDYINIHMGEEYLTSSDMQQGKLAELDMKLNR